MYIITSKLLTILLLLTFSFGTYASEVLSLGDLREIVLSKNNDIKIQYEKFNQAKQNVKSKFGEFLPNLDFQLLYLNSTYSLLYTVVPTPSNWFEYKASNEFKYAEEFATESLRLNILKDLTQTYININSQSKILNLLYDEETLLLDAHEYAKRMETLGLGNVDETFNSLRSLLKHRQQLFALESIINIQKEALLYVIDKAPNSDIVLQDHFHNIDLIPIKVNEAISFGINNSSELISNAFLIEGARYMNTSSRWSFVSFSGIGLGYAADVKISRSKVNELVIKGKKISNEIRNQISHSFIKLDNISKRINIQKDILTASKVNLDRITDLYRGDKAEFKDYIKAQRSVITEKRSLINIKMDYEIQITQMKRLLGLDASAAKVENVDVSEVVLDISVNKRRFGKKYVSADLIINPGIKDQVLSVVYSGDIFNTRLTKHNSDFTIFKKIKASGDKTIKVKVLFTNGKSVELEKTIKL